MTIQSACLSHREYQLFLRHDFTSFIQASFHELNPQTPFLPSPHIELIGQHLEACRNGVIKRLIINLPPRGLKSHCASIAFPAWLLGHNPALRIVCASYGSELAEKLARDTRRLMVSPLYRKIFRTRLSDRTALHDFETTEMGGRMATSVGGSITGRGADFVILDDPMKPDEALSDVQRKSVNNWYDNTLISRLNDKSNGCIIMVMQRLHLDDLVGHVLEQGEWTVLSLPAIAEEETKYVLESPLGRRTYTRLPGEALHPAREPIGTLESLRRQVGEYNFAGQYQQRPTPLGGAMIKHEWFKYYEPGEEPGRFHMKVQSWDTANKSGELNDYSVCTTWGIYDKDFYLLDVYRKRLNYPELKRAVVDMQQRFRPNKILIEDKASGTQLIQDLQRSCHGVKEYSPPTGTDKQIRLFAQSAHFENGHVWLPKRAPWLQEYVAELTSFPGTKYDDQVDSTTQFLDGGTHRSIASMITPELLRMSSLPCPYRRILQPLPREPWS